MSSYMRAAKLGWALFRRFALGSNPNLWPRPRPHPPPVSTFHRLGGGTGRFKQAPTGIAASHICNTISTQVQQPPNRLLSNAKGKWWAQLLGAISRRQNVLAVAALASFGTALASFGALSAVNAYNDYLSRHMEIIPYSKRSHVILIPRHVTRAVSKSKANAFIRNHRRKILPSTHPSSVRAGSIAEKVIHALHKGLRVDDNWGSSPDCASRYAALYLQHVNWRILVVDDNPPKLRAASFSDGTILVHTGVLISHSDAELAFVIGHEVAHVMARHNAAMVSKCLDGLDICILRWKNFDLYTTKNVAKTIKKNRHLSRRHELEADYIGMMLMASAGHDPRAAITALEKLGEDRGHFKSELKRKWMDSSNTHPSAQTRIKSVTEAQEQAMAFYRESLSSAQNFTLN